MTANYSFFISLLFIIILSLVAHLSSASDSITPNTPFSSSSQNLISDGGRFALGFYSPSGNASSQRGRRYYVAIWYNTIREVTPVWIANRETPFSDPASARLSIASDGNLALTTANSTTPIWSTNATGLASNSTTVATLNNTGNLVLRSGSTGKILWQSIEHPTDTWLPGGKLSRNRLTGKSQHLTSWKNSDDPAPGLFSLVLDPDGSSQYLILYNDTNSYWTSGTWNGQIFSLVPEMTSNYIYQFDYVTNETDEDYFIYSLRDDSITTRFIIDVSGQIMQQTWVTASQSWILFWSQPKLKCQVWALCGAYGVCTEENQYSCDCLRGFQQRSPADWALSDRSGGCERTTPLQCGKNPPSNGEQDKFLAMPNTNLPANGVSVAAVVGEGACQAFCLSNCSCTAYSADTGCSVWYGGLLNVQTPAAGNGNTLHLRLAASELPSSKKSKGTLAGAVAGVGVGIIILLAAACLLIRRRRRNSSSKAVDGTLVSFRYSELARATKDFSQRLGGGGFGSVFKGTLPDSTAIAVKKLEGLQQGEKQFRTEVSTIGTIQHVNLVRLHGFCSQGANKLLVYEYMPHGSLDTQLFKRDSSTTTSNNSSSSVLLDWGKRYQIALGTARGLFYLHEKCRDCIIHCDIKPENILLDASFTPKVADFGLAKLVGRDFSRVLTTMRGTRGYLAPEWITGVPITAKADVYSYGMMLFEIVSGRRNSEQTDDGRSGFLPKFAAAKIVAGDTISVLDDRLGGDANLEELDRACRVACWCIQDDEDFRPSMGQVVQILEGNLQVGMPPIPRSLQMFGHEDENIVFFSDTSSTQSSQARSTTSTSTSTSIASQTKSTTSVSD